MLRRIDPRRADVHSRGVRYYVFIAPLCLSGCLTLGTVLPDAAPDDQKAETKVQTAAAYEKYITLNDRLQRVGRKILTENSELCQRTSVDIGVQTATLKTFPKALRDYAKGQGFDDSPRILYSVDPNVKRMARVTDKDGKALSVQKSDFDGHIYIDDAEVQSTSNVATCHYPITLSYSPAVNAYATGRAIRVTTGMMEFANDDELAVIIGHELAHNTEGHITKIITSRIAGLGTGRFSRVYESEADYVGLYYAERAGFDISKAPGIWRRIGLMSVRSMGEGKSHPTTPERYVRLSAGIAEIDRKRIAGLPLLPERRASRK